MKLRKNNRLIKSVAQISTHKCKSLINRHKLRIFISSIFRFQAKGVSMNNLFFKYLDERLHSNRYQSVGEKFSPDHYGPITTISRQAGCSAKVLAEYFNQSINKNMKHPEDKWRCIDKDMMLDSAKKLNLPLRKIKYIYHGQKKTNMDEIFESMASRYYKSDKKIRRTIVEVMREYAEQGNIIVIGRAGVALSKYVPRSFNIRLVAPLQWRIKQISTKHEISEADAQKYIQEIDRRRSTLIEEFAGQKMEESMFDVTFNCEHISHEEIVSTSMNLMKKRGIII